MDRIRNLIKDQVGRIYNSYKKQYGILGMSLYTASTDGTCTPLVSLGNGSHVPLEIPCCRPLDGDHLFTIKEIDDKQLSAALRRSGITHAAFIPEDSDTYHLLAFELIKTELPQRQMAGIELVAEDVTHIVQNALLKIELEDFSARMEQMVAEMGTLHEIGRTLESSGTPDHLLREILEKCQSLMRAEAASLMLLDQETNELEFKVVLGPKSKEVKPLRLPVGKGIGGWVAEKGEPLLIPDAYADPRFNPEVDRSSGYITKSILSVPMKHKARVIGVVNVLNRRDGEPFCESDKKFLTTFASQAALAIENVRLLQSTIEKERLERELKVAGEIQQLIIPQTLPALPGLETAATFIPCKEVSGDFYDIIPLDEHRHVMVVADVAGKGVPAALMVSTMQASLRVYLEHSQDLLYIVHKLNELLIRTTAQDRFITCFFGLYDDRDNSLTFVNAGHNPPILLAQDGSAKLLETGGVFIGSIPWNFEKETILLEPGSLLCMFTDGLFEMTNEKMEQFGMEKVMALLEHNRQETPSVIIDTMIEAARTHIGNKKMDDDLTLLVVKKT